MNELTHEQMKNRDWMDKSPTEGWIDWQKEKLTCGCFGFGGPQICVLSEMFFWSSWCSGLKNSDLLLLTSDSCLGYKSHFFLALGASLFDLRSILNQISLDRGEHSESIWFYMIQLASTQVNSIQLSYSEHLLWDQPYMGHHSAWQTKDKNAHGENVTYSYELSASPLLSTLTSNKLHRSIFYFFPLEQAIRLLRVLVT